VNVASTALTCLCRFPSSKIVPSVSCVSDAASSHCVSNSPPPRSENCTTHTIHHRHICASCATPRSSQCRHSPAKRAPDIQVARQRPTRASTPSRMQKRRPVFSPCRQSCRMLFWNMYVTLSLRFTKQDTLLLMILQLPRPSDMKTLCLVWKDLHALTLPHLYRDVLLPFHLLNNRLTSAFTASHPGLPHIRSLRINKFSAWNCFSSISHLPALYKLLAVMPADSLRIFE
jgi:hypothetical protein